MTDQLVEAISNMKEDEAIRLAQEKLNNGDDPVHVLDLCREAMTIVGQRFEKGDYFLPELMLSGEMLKNIAGMTQEGMTSKAAVKHHGKVLMATVAGDIHDIGKDIVTFMLDVNGFDVRDIGVDVPPEKIIEHIREFQPDVVGLSGLLTLAFDSMKHTVEAIEEAGLRNTVRIMIGGGAIDEEVRKYTGADGYGMDAMAAVSLSKNWTGGK